MQNLVLDLLFFPMTVSWFIAVPVAVGYGRRPFYAFLLAAGVASALIGIFGMCYEISIADRMPRPLPMFFITITLIGTIYSPIPATIAAVILFISPRKPAARRDIPEPRDDSDPEPNDGIKNKPILKRLRFKANTNARLLQ